MLPSLRVSGLNASLWLSCPTDLLLGMTLGQWIASTPRQFVTHTLNLDDGTLSQVKTEKQCVVAGSTSD
jgi:hypothetical protein